MQDLTVKGPVNIYPLLMERTRVEGADRMPFPIPLLHSITGSPPSTHCSPVRPLCIAQSTFTILIVMIIKAMELYDLGV